MAQPQHEQVMFALGDISGKGLAAGMWTTHLVGSDEQLRSADIRPQGHRRRC